MGFVTNKWQPVSAGPTPVPTWERIKNGVTATTDFNYSSYNYTEYLIIVHRTVSNVVYCYQFFYIPEFGTVNQHGGYQSLYVEIQPKSNSTVKFYVRSGTSGTNATSNYKYTIYGRNKAPWSLVSDNSALPNYTELATCNGYYTPFNYQDSDMRTTGGGYWSTSTSVNYSDYKEKVFSNAYTHTAGDSYVYTRLSSNESSWTHINSTTSPVSIADISYSEMFIIGKYLFGTNALNREYQALYVIPDMLNGLYQAGAYTKFQNSKYSGSWGNITVSASSISATYTIMSSGTQSHSFNSLDIYYR